MDDPCRILPDCRSSANPAKRKNIEEKEEDLLGSSPKTPQQSPPPSQLSTLPSLLILYTEKPVWKDTHWFTKMYTLVNQ